MDDIFKIFLLLISFLGYWAIRKANASKEANQSRSGSTARSGTGNSPPSKFRRGITDVLKEIEQAAQDLKSETAGTKPTSGAGRPTAPGSQMPTASTPTSPAPVSTERFRTFDIPERIDYDLQDGAFGFRSLLDTPMPSVEEYGGTSNWSGGFHEAHGFVHHEGEGPIGEKAYGQIDVGENIYRQYLTGESLRHAIVLNEILGPPKALRGHRPGNFGG